MRRVHPCATSNGIAQRRSTPRYGQRSCLPANHGTDKDCLAAPRDDDADPQFLAQVQEFLQYATQATLAGFQYADFLQAFAP